MKNGMTREFDVRLRDEENDNINMGATKINRLAEAEAAYYPTNGWEQAMQLFADSILGVEPRKKTRTPTHDDGDQTH